MSFHTLIQRLKKKFKGNVNPSGTATDESSHRDVSQRPEENTFNTDQPITSRDEDRFNRWPFAQRIADTIARRDDVSSLVIGIYGIWGDGKTSVLRLMEVRFKDYPDVIVVRFNPWHFQSEAQLIRGFFETLADALGKSLPTKMEELGNILVRYGSILSVASISLFHGVAEISPGKGLRELGESLSTVELDDLRDRLESILKESGKRAVVLIDDIDRLDRQEIQAIFKLVKLSAGFHHTLYVLAFDDEVVADALGEKYGRGGPEAGRSFLEKIIQVPLHLPPADQLSLRKLAFEGVEAALRLSGIELTEEQAQAFVHHFVDGLELRLTTPRQAKRYVNGLAFALPILKGEVHPIDQMLLEGIRLFYPKLYVVIRENPDVVLKAGRESSFRDDATRNHAKEVIAKGFEGLEASEQQAAEDLLQVLFPRLEGVFGNTNYGSDWDSRWSREQRICSDEYFQRYFRYCVPPGDVSDQALDRFLEMAATSDEAAVIAVFTDFVRRGAGPRFIAKLRHREESVDPVSAKRLALAVAKSASVLPREKTFFGFDSTFSQTVFLVMKLVRRIPAGPDREDLARQIVMEADPLPFALECLRWFRTDEKEPETERLLPLTVEQEMGNLVAGRIRELAVSRPPYLAFPDDANAMLWVWNHYGASGEVAAYLEGRFVADPSEVSRFLNVFVPTAWGMESGLPHKSRLMRDGYDAMARFVNPDLIFNHLKALYGAELDNPERYPNEDMPVERRAAHQFARIHRAVQTSAASPDGS